MEENKLKEILFNYQLFLESKGLIQSFPQINDFIDEFLNQTP